MNFLHHLTGGTSSAHVRQAAYSHRSTKESTGRRVHADADHVGAMPHAGDNHIGVGVVLVMAINRAAHHTQQTHNKDGKVIPPRDHFFSAMLAPTSDSAISFLSALPAGAYVLVKEANDDIAVYIKFRQAVRSFTVIKTKEMNKLKSGGEEIIDWGKSYRSLQHTGRHSEALLSQPTMMAPVHRMALPMELYHQLEKCWCRFLPHVQAIVFELCSQSYYMDEEIAMEDWSTCILASRVPCIAFVAHESCSFHLFNTTAIAEGDTTYASTATSTTGGSSSSSSAAVSAAGVHALGIPVRLVEFDVLRSLILIADGVFRPSAFIAPVHFSTTKNYDGEVSFAMIRENFFSPDRVALKEATQNGGSTSGGGSASTAPWQDLGASSSSPSAGANDSELQLLEAVRGLVCSTIPHEPLPEGFLSAVMQLHTFWLQQTAESNDDSTPPSDAWATPEKVNCAVQILPYYVELFLSTATTHTYVLEQLDTNFKTNDLLPAFADALQFDLLFMARHVDDATVSRLVHQLLHALSLRADAPPALISLISGLFVELPHFRVLFMRNQGAGLLWKSIHTAATVSLLSTVAAPLLMQAQQQMQDQHQQQSRLGTPLLGQTTKRRSSLFGGGMGPRKANSRNGGNSRKSLLFNASLVLPVTAATTIQVFFRVNPLLVQLELAPQLRNYSFPAVFPASTSLASAPSSSSALSEMVVFLERMAFFLMSEPTSPTWEKDIMQLLCMEDLYAHFHRELVRYSVTVTAATGSSSPHSDDPRLETTLECIAALYRLETKRRRHLVVDAGEKKYWYLFHLLRNPIRAFHERLRDQLDELDAQADSTALDDDENFHDPSSGGGGGSDSLSTTTATTMGLELLVHTLPRLPMQFVTEFVLVSLHDLLQATRNLHEMIQRFPSPSVVPTLMGHAKLLISIFTVILARTCDVDLQILTARIVASSGSCVPAMLQLLVQQAATKKDDDDHEAEAACGIEMGIIRFADAFVTLSTSLVQLDEWHATHESLYVTLENQDDVESNEQRKTILMATILSPENGIAESDDVLWDTLQELLLPSSHGAATAVEDDGRGTRATTTTHKLRTITRFQSQAFYLPEERATDCDSALFRTVTATYLGVRARLFLSPLMDNAKLTASRLRALLETHCNCIYGLREKYKAIAGGKEEEEEEARRECASLALLHLQCLIALASRREQLAVLDEAFLDFRIARELFHALQSCDRYSSSTPDPACSTAATTDSTSDTELLDISKADEARDASVPLSLSLNLSKLTGSAVACSDGTSSKTTTELLLSSPRLHAMALLTIATCTIREPQMLDQRLVPRFFIPPVIDEPCGDSVSTTTNARLPDEDLLWSLQRHLRTATSTESHGGDLLTTAIHASLEESEVTGAFGSPSRAHAVRVLMRLLLPDSYEPQLYCGDSGRDTTTTTDATPRDPLLPLASEMRTYVAKGAFATVFRGSPHVVSAEAQQEGKQEVAIKVCGHQKRSGERCVAAELFNEITVLEKLKGNAAATQLVDYGNNTRETQGFELVMEHCPATLAQWRQSLNVGRCHVDEESSGSPPFRTLLCLVLQVFLQTGRALSQIHRNQICHFDIKADNVLIRVDTMTFTGELLKTACSTHSASKDGDDGQDHVDRPSVPLKMELETPRICLGDFGESVLLPPSGTPHGGDGVLLTRTRGTEAIKSPEMLRVNGSATTTTTEPDGSPTDGHVDPASDIWSLGCLLFELVTEELMFGNDDWSQLYAHLVAPSACALPILREDHRQKLLGALRPQSDAERALADIFMVFLSSILDRDAASRPPLDKVLDEADAQLRMIQALPHQADDEETEQVLLAMARTQQAIDDQKSASSSSSLTTTTTAATSQLLRSPPSRRPHIKDTCGIHRPKLGHLFWNFFVAKDGWDLRRSADSKNNSRQQCATASQVSAAVSGVRLLRELSALQLAHEAHFSHFIYFCFDDVKRRVFNSAETSDRDRHRPRHTSAGPSHSGSGDESVSPFVEIVEGAGRTIFYFNRARVLACLRHQQQQPGHPHGGGAASSTSSATSARRVPSGGGASSSSSASSPPPPSLVRLLLQYSRGILPVLQRHLRHQSKRVLFVPADFTIGDKKGAAPGSSSDTVMVELMTMTLLFFLVASCGLSPLQALTAFSRECALLIDRPEPRLLQQLTTLYDHLQTTRRATAAAVTTEHHQRSVVQCTCGDKVLALPSASLTAKTPMIVPFTTAQSRSLHALEYDAETVWGCGDAHIVYGPQTSSTVWRVVQALDVDRLDSQLRAVLLLHLETAAAANPASAQHERMRRRSQNLLVSRGPGQSQSQSQTQTHQSQTHQSHHHHTGGTHNDNVPSPSLREHIPFLLHGLQESTMSIQDAGDRTRSTESLPSASMMESWTVYVCSMCGARVCAINSSTDKIALPQQTL